MTKIKKSQTRFVSYRCLCNLCSCVGQLFLGHAFRIREVWLLQSSSGREVLQWARCPGGVEKMHSQIPSRRGSVILPTYCPTSSHTWTVDYPMARKLEGEGIVAASLFFKGEFHLHWESVRFLLLNEGKESVFLSQQSFMYL